MFGISKTATMVVALTAAVLIAGAAALIAMNNNNTKNTGAQAVNNDQPKQGAGDYIPDLPPLPDENGDASKKEEMGIYGELINEPHNPLISDAFYKGTVTIMEKDIFEAQAQVSSSGLVESALISEEIIFYDNRTEKCYILGRRLSFTGNGSVRVTHSGGAFSKTADLSSNGDITELYGDLIKDHGKYFDYSKLPLRIDVKSSKIFTVAPTNRQDWVITVVGDEVSSGPPAITPPEELVLVDLGLIPGNKRIDISKTFSNTDSYLDEVSGQLVKPSGTFVCEYKQIAEWEYMKLIAEYSAEIKRLEEEYQSEFIPDLPPLPDEKRDTAVDNVNGLALPQGYPQNVLPISNDAFVVISETVVNEGGKNGFAVTLKAKQNKEDAMKLYGELMKTSKNASAFTMNGISTMTGEKDGHEYNIMIMDNSLGGSEKTMIQIVINPIEN